jgi:YVTN family beta-propeller protein
MPKHLFRWMLTLLACCAFVPAALAGSSSSLLDLSPDGALLLVANSDNNTVTVVDTKERKALREIKVGDKPEGVAWIGNGPLAAVTVYRDDLVVFFDASNGAIVKRLKVFDEPYGIVANRAGTRAWVTLDYPGSILEIDTSGGLTRPAEIKIVAEHKVGPFLRGIALAPDEARLYVSEFYTGVLHAVDPATGKVVDTWKGHSTDNLARHVVIHPRRPKAYVTHVRSKVEVISGSGSIFPQVSICDLVPAKEGVSRRKSIGMDSYNNLSTVTNSYETALTPDGKLIYTIHAGTNDMNISRVLDDDYREMTPIGTPIRIGQNPRAIRVSPDGKTVYIYLTLDFEVGIYDAATMKKQGSVKVCDPAKTPEWVRGKALFNLALQPMTAPRWVACVSCHPDGLSDGRVWQNPEGLRKVPHLFGLAHTHPLHWSADRDEAQDFEYTIRSRLMQGSGLVKGPIKPKAGFKPTELEENLSNRSPDLDALAIYCNSFEVTQLSPHIPAAGKLSESAERGKQLFFSKETACASCHSGPYYTDSTLQKPFKLHDVGTGTDDPSEKMGPRYDTPTLFYVYRTAPYLHHGKAKTLHEVLTTANKEDKHGKTSHLKKDEIDDLVEFLKSLPYELPPLETPNTVKFRVPPKKE